MKHIVSAKKSSSAKGTSTRVRKSGTGGRQFAVCVDNNGLCAPLAPIKRELWRDISPKPTGRRRRTFIMKSFLGGLTLATIMALLNGATAAPPQPAFCFHAWMSERP